MASVSIEEDLIHVALEHFSKNYPVNVNLYLNEIIKPSNGTSNYYHRRQLK